MKQKIIIMGGGLGGLATAHQLLQDETKTGKKYDITIYERNSELGGIARSAFKNGDHTEMCWHAIGIGYTSFLRILNDITDEYGIKVISHLKPVSEYKYCMTDSGINNLTNSGAEFIEESNVAFFTSPAKFQEGYRKLYGKNISFMDKLRLGWMFFRCNSICDARLESYDSQLWSDYVSELCPELKRWLLDSTSIYLGMDYSKISTHFMFHLMRQNSYSPLLDPTQNFYSFDAPMNRVFFDVWGQYLQKRGVKICLNTNIIGFNNNNLVKDIKMIRVHNTVDKSIISITGDIFVNSMDTYNISKLYPTIYLNRKNTLQSLYNKTRQIQCQVLFYIPYGLGIDLPSIYTFPDSEWFLMFRPEAALWGINEREYLSVGIGIFDVKGSKLGKTALECTPLELAQECWHQITKTRHNLKLGTQMPKWDVWHSFKFDQDMRQLSTYEPKFSNNVNTLRDRLTYADSHIKNLYHANACVRTKKNVFNMESACEAGISVANIISQGKITDVNVVAGHTPNTSFWWKILRTLDYFIWKVLRI